MPGLSRRELDLFGSQLDLSGVASVINAVSGAFCRIDIGGLGPLDSLNSVFDVLERNLFITHLKYEGSLFSSSHRSVLLSHKIHGGQYGTRTRGPLLAKQVLSQLS